MLVESLMILVMRKGEELKAHRHASAAATRDIFPTVIKRFVLVLGNRFTRVVEILGKMLIYYG